MYPVNRQWWDRVPVLGSIYRNVLMSEERSRIMERAGSRHYEFDERSTTERIRAMNARALAYFRSLGMGDDTIVVFNLDKMEYPIPEEFQPQVVTEADILRGVSDAVAEVFGRETVVDAGEALASMDQNLRIYLNKVGFTDEKILASNLHRARLVSDFPFEILDDDATLMSATIMVDDRVVWSWRRDEVETDLPTGQPVEDEPFMQPFSLADLGISDEEMEALERAFAEPLTDEESARLANMDGSQYHGAQDLGLSDREILELGLDRLYPAQVANNEGIVPFTLADLGITFTEAHNHDLSGAVYITSGLIDEAALAYIRAHPEVVPPPVPTPEPRKVWLKELPLDINLFLNHPRFVNWLRQREGRNDTVLGLIGDASVSDLIREYLEHLESLPADERTYALYPEISFDDAEDAIRRMHRAYMELHAEATELIDLCQGIYDAERMMGPNRQMYSRLGVQFDGAACQCGPRLELLEIADRIFGAASDDSNYAETLAAALERRRRAEEALASLNVRLVAAPIIPERQYRFMIVGAYSMNVLVRADAPEEAVARLKAEDVLEGNTPQHNRRERLAGRRGWCQGGYEAVIEGLGLVTTDGPMHSDLYGSTLLMRELPYAEGERVTYVFSITLQGIRYSCSITARDFYAALDQILRGEKQLRREGGGVDDVFDFNQYYGALAGFATLTPRNRMFNDGYRIRWQHAR